jgi:pyruvate kinase
VIGRKRRTFPTILAKLPKSNVEKKDRTDWKFVFDLGVDWIVLPSTASIEDLENIKNKINGQMGIISILEKSSMINAFEPMIEASDAILISNGSAVADFLSADVREDIVRTCNRLGRPVIMEAQVFESDKKLNISDTEGIDAAMLFCETLPEKRQFEIIEFIQDIMHKSELDQSRINAENETVSPNKSVVDAICIAAKEAAEFSCANIILLFTNSLKTILRCSRMRMRIPIVLVTESFRLAGRSGICRGIYPVISQKEFNIEQICKVAKAIALDYKFATTGDYIIVLDDISSNSISVCKI